MYKPGLSSIKFLSLLAITIIPFTASAQKKAMTPEVYKIWNRIDNECISVDGKFVAYTLVKEIGDPEIKVYNVTNDQTLSFARAENPQFDPSSNYLLYRIKPHYDSVRLMKLAGKKKDELPNDTLGILNLQDKSIVKIANFKKLQIPQEWGHHAAIMLESNKKKESNDLLWINLASEKSDTLPGVKEFAIPKEKEGLIAYSEGKDSSIAAGLYHYNFSKNQFESYFGIEGKYHQLTFSDDGQHFAFIADLDTSDQEIRPYELYHAPANGKPHLLLEPGDQEIPAGMQLSIHQSITWDEDQKSLYFGLSPIPLLKDTTKLAEELPKVEVWTTDDPVLYTMQEVSKSRDLKKSYLMVYDIKEKIFTRLETKIVDDVRLPKEGSPEKLFAIADHKYQKFVTWLGHDYNDLFLIDDETGEKRLLLEKIDGNIAISPSGDYAYWFDRRKQQYYAYSLESKRTKKISDGINQPLGDELNDRPQAAYPYGMAGWLKGEKSIIVYDRYDLWKIDPTGNKKSERITNGREYKTVYRYIDLDLDDDYITLDGALLHMFDENTKESGYVKMNKPGNLTILVKGPFSYSRMVRKAKDSDIVLYTRESFRQFPDLVMNDLSFQKEKKISKANPQQSEYRWGDGELYSWKDSKGEEMTGMIYKPEGFDPNQQYPLIVNFYERSSDGLHRHRAPFAGRSTISYSYYLSNGYVIFNPDVPYEIGYPGKSALEAVMTGVDAILAEGYIDADRMALQGHSWGGYQIAHILTKTDRFACAEAGAPVVNMTSAYGGIRWGSGMSRMFQYERTQSRLGGTLWETPELYMENSPLFNTDKVNTPVLILHNDKDGAVPWYQGIEYYMALRRLGKKGWLLNYNDEPHWPLKWPNRLDFQTRMEQFFNHYLKGAAMPEWMEKGVPEIEKGKRLGY